MVSSADGTPICYDFYPAATRHAVVVVPGFWRDRSYPSMRLLGQYLACLGLSASILDVRGHGESGGTYGFGLHEHHDVAAVARDLLARGDAETLALVGFSLGGAIAVTTAARHALPFRSLFLISPVAEFSRVVPKINLLTLHQHIAFAQALRRPQFVWNFWKSEKIAALDDIQRVVVPISLVHVKNDWLVNHQHSLLLYEKARGSKELHVLEIPGNFHADRIFKAAPGRIESLLSDFFSRTLEDAGK